MHVCLITSSIWSRRNVNNISLVYINFFGTVSVSSGNIIIVGLFHTPMLAPLRSSNYNYQICFVYSQFCQSILNCTKSRADNQMMLWQNQQKILRVTTIMIVAMLITIKQKAGGERQQQMNSCSKDFVRGRSTVSCADSNTAKFFL